MWRKKKVSYTGRLPNRPPFCEFVNARVKNFFLFQETSFFKGLSRPYPSSAKTKTKRKKKVAVISDLGGPFFSSLPKLFSMHFIHKLPSLLHCWFLAPRCKIHVFVPRLFLRRAPPFTPYKFWFKNPDLSAAKRQP